MARPDHPPTSPLDLLLGAQGRDESGIVFVTTADQRQVRIGLDGGRIVHVGFGYRRGRVAAEHAASTIGVSATFRAGLASVVDTDLPPERALLALLLPMLTGNAGAAGSRPASDDSIPTLSTPLTGPGPVQQQAPAPPTVAAPRAAAPPAQMGRVRIAQIKSALLEFVGPMADLLVDEQLAAGVGDLDTLVDRLADQIGSARDGQAFRDVIRKLQG